LTIHAVPGADLYETPAIVDLGTLVELTAGCVGGVPEDSKVGADLETFPADSGLICP
jgi:hypothetical protein